MKFREKIGEMRCTGTFFKNALVDVTEIAEVVNAWFERRGLHATPADIIELTRLVIEREAVIRAEDANERSLTTDDETAD